MPRMSFYDATGWTHTFETPEHKKTRAIISGACDFFVAAAKLLPADKLGPDFAFLQRLLFFGHLRCFQVSNPTEFKVFRRDYLQDLMVEYRHRFRGYRVVWNPNFLETFTFVDNGLGTVFNWHALSGMRFESWHQTVKGDSRKGAGISLLDVHHFHNRLHLKAMLAMDLELRTLGRIPPTRELRISESGIHPDIFKQRYHDGMLGQQHGSRRPERDTRRSAEWYSSRSLQKGLVPLTFRRMKCLCRNHYRGDSPQIRALLLVCRNLARRARAANPRAFANDPLNAGGHVWTPGGFKRAGEWRFPHSETGNIAHRMLHALATKLVSVVKTRIAHLRGWSLATGSVRPGHGDHVLTRGTPNVGNPPVVAVQTLLTFRGVLSAIHDEFPCEAPGVSTWIAGRAYTFAGGDAALVRTPWRGGVANMKICGLDKQEENHAVPLAEVQEPTRVTHKCVHIVSFYFNFLGNYFVISRSKSHKTHSSKNILINNNFTLAQVSRVLARARRRARARRGGTLRGLRGRAAPLRRLQGVLTAPFAHGVRQPTVQEGKPSTPARVALRPRCHSLRDVFFRMRLPVQARDVGVMPARVGCGVRPQ